MQWCLAFPLTSVEKPSDLILCMTRMLLLQCYFCFKISLSGSVTIVYHCRLLLFESTEMSSLEKMLNSYSFDMEIHADLLLFKERKLNASLVGDMRRLALCMSLWLQFFYSQLFIWEMTTVV